MDSLNSLIWNNEDDDIYTDAITDPLEFEFCLVLCHMVPSTSCSFDPPQYTSGAIGQGFACGCTGM